MKKNKKGFTLMELLAVIVILSVLILLAMPAVLRLMENAKKNAFKTEGQSLYKICQTAYTDISMTYTELRAYEFTYIPLYKLKDLGYTDKNIFRPVNDDDQYSYCLLSFYGSNETGIVYTDNNFVYIKTPLVEEVNKLSDCMSGAIECESGLVGKKEFEDSMASAISNGSAKEINGVYAINGS